MIYSDVSICQRLMSVVSDIDGVDIQCPVDITSTTNGREGGQAGMVAILNANHTDAGRVAKTLSSAFVESNRVGSWLVPGEVEHRRRVLVRFFRAVVEHALTHGEVRVSQGRDAVVISYPGRPPWSLDGKGSAIASALGKHVRRFKTLVNCPARTHPRIEHQYLAYLAVHPGRQGNDLERRLLYDRIGFCQFHSLPIYFEAPDPGVRMLCLSMGFRDYGPAPFVLPRGPEIYPLLWRPRR